VRVLEVRAPEVRVLEVRALEVRAPEVRVPEVRVPEVRAPEVRAPEVRVLEVRAPEVRAPEVRALTAGFAAPPARVLLQDVAPLLGRGRLAVPVHHLTSIASVIARTPSAASACRRRSTASSRHCPGVSRAGCTTPPSRGTNAMDSARETAGPNPPAKRNEPFRAWAVVGGATGAAGAEAGAAAGAWCAGKAARSAAAPES